MSEPVLLFCVGATKAGTSWLYRTLADRADSAFPAVKELHYWDTMERTAKADQVARFRDQLARLSEKKAEAAQDRRGWQVANLERRMTDMQGLIDVSERPRDGHARYKRFLLDRARTAAITGDVTPAYALLPPSMLSEMMTLHSRTKMVYMMRDPLSRLWSAIRMQARRQLSEGQTVEAKANATLWRILNKGHETHLTARGDYASALEKLGGLGESAVRLVVMEEVTTQSGYDSLCDWLEIARDALGDTGPVHEGAPIAMRQDLRGGALTMLRPQYAAACEALGYVPEPWRANMEAGA